MVPASNAAGSSTVAEMAVDDRIEVTTPEGVQVTVSVAGVGARFLARLLDTLIQFGAIIALLIVAGVLGDNGFVVAFLVVGFSTVLFGYDLIFEPLMNGRTPGKAAAGIRVVDRDGAPVPFLRSAVRNVVRLVDFLPFAYGAGLVTMIATQHAQRLGDLAAGTLVVRDRSTREIEMRARSSHATPTVPLVAVIHWDVTLVTAQDLATIRHFLDRRISLPAAARSHLANSLASSIAARVNGPTPELHPEYVLEGIIVAKERPR